MLKVLFEKIIKKPCKKFDLYELKVCIFAAAFKAAIKWRGSSAG
ncbi:MAG: hypothetical protein R2879_08355 [Saprospiraceae bacterium]